MNSESVLNIPTQVMARQVGDETVILDLASGLYFGLDEVGTRVWEMIGDGASIARICEQLGREYEVAPDVLARDVNSLLGELRSRGLVTLER
jgi:hypothetical protein